MAETPGESGSAQWIVSARRGAAGAAQLTADELVHLLNAPGVQIVSVQRSASRPRAVIRASAATVEQLQRVYADRLLIAPDRMLSLFPDRRSDLRPRARGRRLEMSSDSSTTHGDDLAPLSGGGKRQYLIAPRRGVGARATGVQPMAVTTFNATVASLGIEVVRRVRRGSGTIQTLSAGPGESTDVVVARLDPARAELLSATAPPNLMIAEDKPLGYGRAPGLLRAAPSVMPMSLTGAVNVRQITIRVVGVGDKPLPKVSVQLAGDGYPANGVTNNKGEVQLQLATLGNRPARLLFVTPPDSYWDFYLESPPLNEHGVNLVRLRALSETISGFPQQFQYGWGQRLMGLEALPRELGGAGVKIAIIDSGCDNTHPLLGHVQLGRDFTDSGDPNVWTQDDVGHGTHCAGVIAAKPADGAPMRGFAPDAEIHVLRIFPGGQYSSLLEALDYCVDHQIDVVNMSLGGDDEINPVVEETIEIAALNGIACVVAAGNSGDAVKYPASSPQTIAIAALGSTADLQPDTWDSTTVQTGLIAADGLFSPSFTCHGPEIGICAPGVGIVSTVPGGHFEPQSGTSMAAPHVTGMAALLLAHHPVFRSQFAARSPQRVSALFNMLRSVARPYAFGADRTGAGLPGLQGIVDLLMQTLQAQPQAQPPQAAQPQATQPGLTTLGAVGPLGAALPIGGVAPLAAGPAMALGGWGGMPTFNNVAGPQLSAFAAYPTTAPAFWVDPQTAALLLQGRWRRAM